MHSNIYPFKTEPFAHQLKAWELSKDKESFALFMEMGTGKSKAVSLLGNRGMIEEKSYYRMEIY